MKNLISNINKLFESRIRLGIMSILMVNEQVEFNQLKEMLDVSDGNLASHIKSLEKADYLSVHKEFVQRKPKTSYKATTTGNKAFKAHLDALENLIKRQ
jgi:DNA-binding HxlR family transcriptional regulator